MSGNVAPFAWYGGKSRLAATIVGLLPRHDSYVEAFGGSAAVLASKPRSVLEVYNDIDSGLVIFFRVLREQPDKLLHALELTPYSREEFREAVATWKSIEDDVERARRWYVRCRQAFAASAATVGWGFEIDGGARGGTRARSFATSVDQLERFAQRFRTVQIDHLDWRDCLDRYDRGGACFYLDPPYHPATRGERGLHRNSSYVHELSEDDHCELVDRVARLEGSVLISGYEHPSYAPLTAAGFERFELAHTSTASRKLAGRGPRVEVIWRRLEDGLHEQLTFQAEA